MAGLIYGMVNKFSTQQTLEYAGRRVYEIVLETDITTRSADEIKILLPDMITKEAAYDAIVKRGIMPLFYYPDVDVCVEVVRTLYRAGVRVMEVTCFAPWEHFWVDSALKQRVAEEMRNDTWAGNTQDHTGCYRFSKAGADFFVAPNLGAAVAAVAAEQ